MSLRPSEAREALERECTFPADQETLVEQVGDVEIIAPSGENTELTTALERTGADHYRSVQAAFSDVLAGLGDDHVGRKHYDDRSPNPCRTESRSF